MNSCMHFCNISCKAACCGRIAMVDMQLLPVCSKPVTYRAGYVILGTCRVCGDGLPWRARARGFLNGIVKTSRTGAGFTFSRVCVTNEAVKEAVKYSKRRS